MDQTAQDKIEALLAYQEQKIDDLSDMVARQWDEIERLKQRLKRTQDKLKTVEDLANAAGKSDQAISVSEFAAQEKPPHY